ncbi:uncharacterized protein BJX67DRAFT_352308 [Aspergillus lucknowensis]|uniref:Uncharacterized protein n=1 Tax=Aspergillus lucknowensis TaxID=176173 RepID=A0ABR4LWR2_9EURO
MRTFNLFFLAIAQGVVMGSPIESSNSLSARQEGVGCDCIFSGGDCFIDNLGEGPDGAPRCRSKSDNTLSYVCTVHTDTNTYDCNACFQSGHQATGSIDDTMCLGTQLCEGEPSCGIACVPTYYPCGNA